MITFGGTKAALALTPGRWAKKSGYMGTRVRRSGVFGTLFRPGTSYRQVWAGFFRNAIPVKHRSLKPGRNG